MDSTTITKYHIKPDRKAEWPIQTWWYTTKKGQSMGEVIDRDLDFFMWAVTTFQNVTPDQAEYFTKKTGKVLNKTLIQDVEPYVWQKGDPEELYMELCDTQDLKGTLEKYRGPQQLELF